MKTITVNQVMNLAKCSKSTAIEIVYRLLFEKRRVYLNKKNNATATIKWLTKNFDANFTAGNDAPRGGKIGDYVDFTANSKFDELQKLILQENAKLAFAKEKTTKVNQEMVNAMVISESEKINFLEKTKDLSNKKARIVAHNFAARKLGFYSNQAKDLFMNLRRAN
jgi:hypothetical protein